MIRGAGVGVVGSCLKGYRRTIVGETCRVAVGLERWPWGSGALLVVMWRDCRLGVNRS
jgi:hypothetical protein